MKIQYDPNGSCVHDGKQALCKNNFTDKLLKYNSEKQSRNMADPDGHLDKNLMQLATNKQS